MDDLVSDFVCEAADGLGGLQVGLVRLAGDGVDASAAADMARRLHGLKGLCGFLGFTRAEALAHAGEDLLATGAGSSYAISSPALASLGDMIARLGELFSEAATARCEPEGDDADLIGRLEVGALTRRGAQFREAHGASPGVGRRAPDPSAATEQPERRTRAPWIGLDTLARALGDRLGKRIDLMVGGDDVRISPAAAAPLRTALIALVRNACDHGVETPEERRLAAKPARALLRLSVHRTRDGAVIEFADDGRGVDPAQVRQRCVDSGRLAPDDAATLADADAQALIFAPGVTTAPAVTAFSGRGLGLDLVRREVEALGGQIELCSSAGAGARFIVRLPAAVLATSAARARAAA